MNPFPWPLVAAMTTLFVFFGGVLVTVIHSLLKSNQKHADRRFESIEKALESKASAVASLRAEIAEHKLYVSENYVHREDFVRVEGAKAVLLSNLKEEVGSMQSNLTRLATLIDERLPASPRA
ncbi:MAG: hypothetical protein LCH53_06080 [Bacteroidetes bacterium]|nr:hypothetical protein [Bacteroidota bacterium]